MLVHFDVKFNSALVLLGRGKSVLADHRSVVWCLERRSDCVTVVCVVLNVRFR